MRFGIGYFEFIACISLVILLDSNHPFLEVFYFHLEASPLT